jgi:hypothetical protein
LEEFSDLCRSHEFACMQIQLEVRQVMESAMSATIFQSVPSWFRNFVTQAYKDLIGQSESVLQKFPLFILSFRFCKWRQGVIVAQILGVTSYSVHCQNDTQPWNRPKQVSRAFTLRIARTCMEYLMSRNC